MDSNGDENGLARRVAQLEAEVEALRAERDMLHNVLDCVPLGIFWKGRDFRYDGYNVAFMRMSGLESKTALVGKTDFELLPKPEAERCRAQDASLIDGREESTLDEVSAESLRGERLWVHLVKVPVRDGSRSSTRRWPTRSCARRRRSSCSGQGSS